MGWIQKMNADGALVFDGEGRAVWKCSGCGRPAKSHGTPALCPCEELKLPCAFRVQLLAASGCCGGPTVRIYHCAKLGPCVLAKADAELIEIKGKPVMPCEGCEIRPTADSPQ